VMFEIREMTGQEYRNHYAGEQVETSTDVPVVAQPAHVSDPAPVPGRRTDELVGASG